MKKFFISLFITALLISILPITPVLAGSGFDEYGYNLTARNFVGTGESWAMGKFGMTEAEAEAYLGIYAHDQLVMKWNAEWDRGNLEGWANPPYKAWETNEWNGAVGKDFDGSIVEGSGEVWHYKIVWVGSDLELSEYWRPGGYPIWGQFEVIMDQGTVIGEGHYSLASATPNGFGIMH